MLAKPKQPARIERALRMRDPAIRIAREKAPRQRADIQNGPTSLSATWGRLGIEYRTPSLKGYAPILKLSPELATVGVAPKHWPYLLEISGEHHSQPRKNVTLMTLEWDEKGNSHLSKFLSGEWEASLDLRMLPVSWRDDKAKRRFPQLEGLDVLAESLGLYWYMDDHGTQNIYFYLGDKVTGKRLHGPFNDFNELDEKMNSLHLAQNRPSH